MMSWFWVFPAVSLASAIIGGMVAVWMRSRWVFTSVRAREFVLFDGRVIRGIWGTNSGEVSFGILSAKGDPRIGAVVGAGEMSSAVLAVFDGRGEPHLAATSLAGDASATLADRFGDVKALVMLPLGGDLQIVAPGRTDGQAGGPQAAVLPNQE